MNLIIVVLNNIYDITSLIKKILFKIYYKIKIRVKNIN